MRWMGRRESDNVEVRRGIGGGTLFGGGIGALVIGLIVYLMGGDPSQIIGSGESTPQSQTAPQDLQNDPRVRFVKVVFADTEDVWGSLFNKMGKRYENPQLVIFYDGGVNTACGNAGASVGPFYCPLDQKVYIDLSFQKELKERFEAPGDFAMAYVVAHEVGHHVQNLLGISEKVQAEREHGTEQEANALSVRLELQADFFAGVWAHYDQKMKDILEPGDIEEALNAANAVGDDRLQSKARGEVNAETFTHGTSAQRMYWFKKGFETGDIAQGDTFAADAL